MTPSALQLASVSDACLGALTLQLPLVIDSRSRHCVDSLSVGVDDVGLMLMAATTIVLVATTGLR